MKDIKSQFIVSAEVSAQRIEELAKRALTYGRITEAGLVVIDDKSLTQDDKLRLALVIRFIASKLDDSISPTLRPLELVDVLHERLEAVGSRLSKLAKNGFAKRVEHGQYSVLPYRIEVFLDGLDMRDKSKSQQKTPRRPGSAGARKPKELTGIGLDVQKIIDSGFFNVPRLMNEINAELKKETKYHDPKVLDMTIRKTFVNNRRALKRIPNSEGGKARWRYVR